MAENWDVAIISTVGMALNMVTTRKRPIWHIYQICVAICMATHVYSKEWGYDSPFDTLNLGDAKEMLLKGFKFVAGSPPVPSEL